MPAFLKRDLKPGSEEFEQQTDLMIKEGEKFKEYEGIIYIHTPKVLRYKIEATDKESAEELVSDIADELIPITGEFGGAKVDVSYRVKELNPSTQSTQDIGAKASPEKKPRKGVDISKLQEDCERKGGKLKINKGNLTCDKI